MKKSLYKALSVFFSIFLLFNLCSCDLFEDFLGKFCGGIGPNYCPTVIYIDDESYYLCSSDTSNFYFSNTEDGPELQDWKIINTELNDELESYEIINLSENIDIILYIERIDKNHHSFKYKLVSGSKEISNFKVNSHVCERVYD